MVTHGEFLRNVSRDDELVFHLQRDHALAPLGRQEAAMLAYVTALTLEPRSVNEADVEGLRSVGFDDRSILDIVLVTAMFAFMNRLATGLGVEPERQFVESRERAEHRRDAGLPGEGELRTVPGNTQ